MARVSTAASQTEGLADLARRLATLGPNKTMPTPRRIRILFNGAIVIDTEGTSGALYVWEHEHYPQFYIPMEAIIKPSGFDVQLSAGEPIEAPAPSSIVTTTAATTTTTTDTKEDPNIVVAGFLQLNVKRTRDPESAWKTLSEIVLFAADLSGPGAQLRNMVKIRFDAVGQWFEEDTPIYIHPKDPFKRVDILSSSGSRPIRVLIDGVTVAESRSSMHLYETSLPVRYYLPLTSLDTSLLHPSTSRSQCPYKGEAQYHSVIVGGLEYKDICWYYTRPTVECAAIAGMCCFYNEKVDIEVKEKGQWRRLERPVTHFA